MTADQLALAQLSLAHWQLWVTSAAIFLGPITGATFTIWFQRRKEKHDAMTGLFINLMANRKVMPPTMDLVKGLNVIDVVFSDFPKVVKLWHEYYDLLSQTPLIPHLLEDKYLDLLSAMSQAIGYRRLSQTAIARFYSPMAHTNQAQLDFEIQQEFLRVLKMTGSLTANPRDDENKV